MNERPLIEQLGNHQLSAYRQYLRIFVGEESPAAFLTLRSVNGTSRSDAWSLGVFSARRMLPMDTRSAWPGKRLRARGDDSFSTTDRRWCEGDDR